MRCMYRRKGIDKFICIVHNMSSKHKVYAGSASPCKKIDPEEKS